jgi:DNA-binding transcriptional regulator of glucitol operon
VRGLLTPKRLAVFFACVVSLVGCCALAWWQWERFSSASGSFQNLGYVLQWPLFGLFPAFMVWRLRRLNAQHAAEQAEGAGTDSAVPAEPPAEVRQRHVPVAHDDEDPDDEHAAYNRYLAELHARDRAG